MQIETKVKNLKTPAPGENNECSRKSQQLKEETAIIVLCGIQEAFLRQNDMPAITVIDISSSDLILMSV